ncbi:MAG: hypothetical protein AB1847_17040 [bacterium]
MILAAAALYFLFMLPGGRKGGSQAPAKRQAASGDTYDQKDAEFYRYREQSLKGGAKRPGAQGPHESLNLSPFLDDTFDGNEKEGMPPEGNSLNTSRWADRSGNAHYFPSQVALADIADYDAIEHRYDLKKIDLFANSGDVPAGLLPALKVLNRKDMPQDYFTSWDYEHAYNEINMFYPDYYIWPYFTNREAKTNFFLFLFNKYAKENKRWRSYEKDVSDCTQFTQRIYLMLNPGEVHMDDEQYFRFLFSDEGTRQERKKLCNKIPHVFYTQLDPYVLKRIRFDSPLSGHAMICFAPDGSLQDVIIAEPQSGDFEPIEGNIGRILNNLDEPITRYPLICRLGKIRGIEKDKSHEADIAVSGVYFFPRLSSSFDSQYEPEDPRLDYGQKSILLQDQTYYLFRVISSYLKGVLDDRAVDRVGYLHSIDAMMRSGNLTLPNLEGELSASINLVMHGLITLDISDLRRIKDEVKELKASAEGQPSISPQITDLVTRLNYLFLLKLEPLLG